MDVGLRLGLKSNDGFAISCSVVLWEMAFYVGIRCYMMH